MQAQASGVETEEALGKPGKVLCGTDTNNRMCRWVSLMVGALALAIVYGPAECFSQQKRGLQSTQQSENQA